MSRPRQSGKHFTFSTNVIAPETRRASLLMRMFGNQRCVSVTTVLFFTFLAVVGECQGVDARDGDTAAPLPRDAQGQLRVVFDGGSTDAHRVNHLRLLSNAFVENEAFEIVEANAGVGGGHGDCGSFVVHAAWRGSCLCFV